MKLSLIMWLRIIGGAFAFVAILFLFIARERINELFIIAMLMFAASMILGIVKTPEQDIDE